MESPSNGAQNVSRMEVLEPRQLLAVLVNADLHRPPRLAVADFDGDGRADLAVITQASKKAGSGGNAVTVEVYHNNGDGTSSLSKVIPARTPPGGVADAQLAAGDVDGDGRADLVYKVFTTGQGGAVGILKGDGKGSFSQGTVMPLPPSDKPATHVHGDPHVDQRSGVAVGDVDGDGLGDVVSWDGGLLTILHSEGKGDLSKPRSSDNPLYQGNGNAGSNPFYEGTAGLADMNGDGRDDLVGYSNGNIVAATLDPLNPGKATPIQFNNFPKGPSPKQSSRLLLADVNGDGDPDLIVASPGQIQVGLNQGAERGKDRIPIKWMPPEVLKNSFSGVLIGDLDGDGKDELFNVLKTKHDTLKNSVGNIR